MRAPTTLCALLLAACQAGPAGENQAAGNASAETGADLPASENGSVVASRDPDRPVSSDDPPAPPQPDRPTADCPVASSSDWRAQVDAMPGPNDNPRLIVSGKVTVPTGGYRLSLRLGQVAESYPVQVTIYLDATPPTGMASQALATHDVRGSWPSEERVGAVTVRCGSRTLARIGNIGTAH